MIEIRSVHHFDISVPVLWSFLARLEKVSEWNSLITLKGSAALNAEIRIAFKEMVAKRPNAEGPARIVRFDPPHSIGWQIRIPVFLQIEESFTVSKSGTGSILTHQIVSTGLVAVLAPVWLSRHLQKYLEDSDVGLKRRACRPAAAKRASPKISNRYKR